MKKIKGLTHILPFWKFLKQKLLQTIFVNWMWLNATAILDGFLKPAWFFRDSMLMQVIESVLYNSMNYDDSDICSNESESNEESDL